MQIEEGYRKPTEHRADAARRGHFREVETRIENPDAEPVAACNSERPALIIFGQHIGTFLTVCTDNHCPVHDPRQAKDRAERPVPVMAPPTEDETEEQTAARKADYARRQAAYVLEQERQEAARQEEQERRDKESEAEQEQRAKQKKKRAATFDRILKNAPPVFDPAQLRALLRALINMDPYSFADDLAVEFNGDDDNDQRCAEEVLLTVIDGLDDTKLTGFAVHLALAGHRNIPKEGEIDFLAEAAAVFLRKDKASPAKKVLQPSKTSAKAAKATAPSKAKAQRKA